MFLQGAAKQCCFVALTGISSTLIFICYGLKYFLSCSRLSFHLWWFPLVYAMLYTTTEVTDSVWSHRRKPTRLPRPWGSPGKNTGVGCHFLLQCVKVKSESEVTQSRPTLSDPMDCSLTGSSVHGIFQARVLEWSAIAFPELRKPLYPQPQLRA